MRGTLPAWVERLLGVDAAETGEGTVWAVQHTWTWPAWLTVLFLAGVVVLLSVVAWRDTRSTGRWFPWMVAGLRLAAVLLVLVMLAELSLSRERTGLPYVVVLVDDSASMSIVDRYDDTELRDRLHELIRAIGAEELSRLNLARAVLTRDDAALLRAIDRDHKLKVYFVSALARPQAGGVAELTEAVEGLEATGEASRLGDAVRRALDDLRGAPPAALVLVTDGIVTDGERLAQAAEYAAGKHVPLHVVALGSTDPVRNLKLHELLVDDRVFVNDVVNFEGQVTATGLAGQPITVRLKNQETGDVLAETQLEAGPDGEPQGISIPYRPTQPGRVRYAVEVVAVADEDQTDDNEQERAVEVFEGKIKVLLVAAQPSFEFRRLKDLLERDDTIELRTVLQEADLEYAGIDRSALKVFPVRRDKLGDDDQEALFYYDVVIFGDVNPAFLSAAAMRNLADFVSVQGRGLVFIAGPRFTPTAFRGTPLAPLLPVELDALSSADLGQAQDEAFQVQPTDLGLASPHMQLGDTREETAELWRNLPPLYWLFEAPRLKPGARVLAEHPLRRGDDGRPLPIFVLHYVNRGKVLLHATEETWRWRFRVGDVLFARYWVQTIRYLSRSKLQGDSSAELTADRREYRRGEPVRLRLQFFDERAAPADDEGVTIVLERAGQPRRQVALRRNASNRGVFEGSAAGLPDGAYHGWVAAPAFAAATPAVDFSVTAPPGEFRQVQMDLAELEAAVEQSHGRLYRPHEAARLPDYLPEGRQVPIEALPPRVLWNTWPVMLAFALLLVSEWLLRKWRGLV
jgi:hypothetical protein